MARSRRTAGEADGNKLWSRERIILFSPDDASIPAAEKVLKKGGFGTVEATADGKGWWVVCRGLTDTYQVSLRVEEGAFVSECTCPSPKYPCKHAIALVMYLLDHPERRAEPEAPKHAATDFEALVRAVFQNPDDDTARLVFADYLDENDQPDRAALIRVQCEHSRAPAKSAQELGEEVKRLTKRVRAAFVDPLPEGTTGTFHRGFLELRPLVFSFRDVGAMPARYAALFRDGWVEAVRLQAYSYFEEFDEELAALFSLAGELDLSKASVSEDSLIAVAALVPTMQAGRLSRVKVPKHRKKAFDQLLAARESGLDGGAADPGRVEDVRHYRSLTPQTLDLVIRSGRIRSGRELFLDGTLGDEEARQVAEANLSGVESLVLSRWKIGAAGLAALANSGGMPDLTQFSIVGSRLDPAAVAALDGPAFGRLERLFLNTAQLTDAGSARLARCTRFRSLQHLDVSMNDLTAAGPAAFLRSPNFPALTSLDVGGNAFDTPDLLPLLIGAADRPTLTLTFRGQQFSRRSDKTGVRLGIDIHTQLGGDLFANLKPGTAKGVVGIRVSRAGITGKGLRALAKAFDPGTLREIEFRDVAMRNEGAEEFGAAFKDFRPETLRLSFCRIQASGAVALAASPVLSSVRVLDLSGNGLGKAGAAALAKSPHLGKLQRLELTDWRVGADERKVLKAKFGTKLVI